MNRAGGPAHRLAYAALVAAGALVAGACRDLAAGDAVDFAQALCDELERCTGDDACAVRTALESAEVPVVQSYLELAAREDCLESCRDAKRCLDAPPVCVGFDEPCGADADCCGASQALGRCERSAQGAVGACCGELGARCEPTLGGCCDGEPCLVVGDEPEGRCGGFECAFLGEACTSNFECCSRRCEEGSCASTTCGKVGDRCLEASDCCPQNLPDGTTRPLECRAERCAAPEEVCVGCDPLDAANCCIASGLVCYEAIDGSSFCGGTACSPLGVTCATDGDCCASDGAVCSRSGAPHCAKPCADAGDTGCCRPAPMECTLGAQCCSGSCVGGRCAAVDVGCAPTACHSPRTTGAPLDPADEACGGESSWDPECVAAVCAERSRCCCLAWDLACAEAFVACAEAP